MSLISGSINEGEQAGEKLSDHAIDHAATDAPAAFAAIARAILDVLSEYEFSIGVRKRQ